MDTTKDYVCCSCYLVENRVKYIIDDDYIVCTWCKSNIVDDDQDTANIRVRIGSLYIGFDTYVFSSNRFDVFNSQVVK